MTPRDRGTYIGSSDAKDILAGNWNKLWMEKTGKAERADLSDQFNVQLGIFTEDLHLDWTIRRMIEAGEIMGELNTWRQKEMSPEGVKFVAAHIDAAVYLDPEEDGETAWPVEAKHSSGARTIDELLEWYMPQMQHHLWCTGASKGVISVIQGNKEPERVWIGRSEAWLDTYSEACKRFWQHMTDNKPPLRESPGVHIPSDVKDAIPINGLVRRCADTDNAFIAAANDLIDNEAAAKLHDGAKKDLKKMMGEDEGELYSKILTLKKDKRGAVRMTIHEKAS